MWEMDFGMADTAEQHYLTALWNRIDQVIRYYVAMIMDGRSICTCILCLMIAS